MGKKSADAVTFYRIWEAEGGSLLFPVSMGINFISQEVFRLISTVQYFYTHLTNSMASPGLQSVENLRPASVAPCRAFSGLVGSALSQNLAGLVLGYVELVWLGCLCIQRTSFLANLVTVIVKGIECSGVLLVLACLGFRKGVLSNLWGRGLVVPSRLSSW